MSKVLVVKSKKSPKSKKSNTVVEDLLANASTALDVATQFGPLIPIPIVSSLIASAQVVVKAAQVRWKAAPQPFEL